MKLRWACMLVGLAAIVSSWPAGVRAQDQVPVASLTYDVPESCPDRQTFEDLVAARLGYVAFVDDSPLDLAVSITQEEGRFAGLLQPSSQQVRGGSCDRVGEALAMLVAIAIDPLGEGAAAAAERPRQPLSEDLHRLDAEPPPMAVAATSVEAETPAGATGPFVSARARVHGSVGLAPAASLGGGVGAGLRWGGFSIGAELLVETTPLGSASQGVELSGMELSGTMWRAGLSSCWGAGALSACGLAHLGQLHARTDAALSPSSGSAVIAYVGARLGLGFEALDLRWAAELDVVTPFVRASVELGSDTAWSAPLVAASLALSVQLEAR